MESAALTATDLHRLDAFHHSTLRKILNIKTTYYTEVLDPTAHTFTNKDVQAHAPKCPPLSQTIAALQSKLLGHLLRADSTDLSHDVCFNSVLAYRQGGFGDRRRGRGRVHWAEQAATVALHRLEDSLGKPYSQPSFPSIFLDLRSVAQHRAQWFHLVVKGKPTHSEASHSSTVGVVHTDLQ